MSAAARSRPKAPPTPHVVVPIDAPDGSVRFHTRELVQLLLGGLVVAGTAVVAPSMAPAVVAALVAALIPRPHATLTRVVLAAISALFVVFVVRMWPTVGEIPADLPPPESPTLLSWLVGLPIAGAIAVLFLPRQAPGVLRWTTLLVMLGTLGASLLLLQAPMGRAFHYNQDVVWIARSASTTTWRSTASRSGSSSSRR